MYIYTIENLHLGEIRLLRSALDVITVNGSDAKFVANLQTKLESEIAQIEEKLAAENKPPAPPKK